MRTQMSLGTQSPLVLGENKTQGLGKHLLLTTAWKPPPLAPSTLSAHSCPLYTGPSPSLWKIFLMLTQCQASAAPGNPKKGNQTSPFHSWSLN